MWFLDKLTIQNFISHSDSTFEFKTGKTVLIQGNNVTDSEQDSNGSGKSSVIDAICYCLTGDWFRNAEQKDLIQNGEDSAVLSLSMSNNSMKENLYIEKTITKKESSVNIKLNNKEIVKSSVNEYNKFIIEKIGISKEDLMNYFIISKDNYKSFFSISDTKKKEIIQRFSNSEILNDVQIEIEKDLNIIQPEISKLEKLSSNLDGKLTILYEQKDSFNEEIQLKKFEEDQKEILNIESILEVYKEDISKFEANIIKLRENLLEEDYLEDYKKESSKLNKKLEDVKEEMKEAESFYNETKSLNRDIEKKIQPIQKNLIEVTECPKCKNEFVVTDKGFDVKKGKKEYILLNKDKKQNENVLKELEELENENLKYKKEVQKEIDTLDSNFKILNREQINIKSNIDNIQSDIKRLLKSRKDNI